MTNPPYPFEPADDEERAARALEQGLANYSDIHGPPMLDALEAADDCYDSDDFEHWDFP